MSHGLQCWDNSGVKTLDTDQTTTRQIGSFPIGFQTSGQISHPLLATGEFFWAHSPIPIATGQGNVGIPAIVSFTQVNSTTYNWSVDMRGQPAQAAGTVYYGVFGLPNLTYSLPTLTGYGLQARGDNGFMQIDGSSPNLGLVAKGTRLPPANTGVNNPPNYVLGPFTGTAPILALTGRVRVTRVQQSGNTFWWHLTYSSDSAPPLFDYYIFDSALPPPISSHGLEIFQGQQRIFCSDAHQMRVVGHGVINYGNNWQDRSFGPGTLFPGKRLAYIQSKPNPYGVEYRYDGQYTVGGQTMASSFTAIGYYYYNTLTPSPWPIDGNIGAQAEETGARLEIGGPFPINPTTEYNHTEYNGDWDGFYIDVTGYL